ncbi:hypothetical protein LSH36_55g04036 [Paralvinella palmiformis]|uniref:Mitochondrial import inner membrane translocase subunit TIM16 n=1 Tax=Paralvinella palmiformis TaxID=53620 RepID=A0AAD9NCB5_9ANNE|nr:hypothetical protein LSH36_55g04036 [Paralvinella palmiformis]
MIVVTGVQIVGRAFTRAIRQEIQASQHAAQARASTSNNRDTKTAASDALTGMSLSEAKQILNLDDIDDPELVKKNYEHLFNINEKAKGGSFYLQSKVYRAHERIEQEMKAVIEEAEKKRRRHNS